MPNIEVARYRYSLRNPFPPPDSRYRLAKACLEAGVTPSLRFDDKKTWNIYRFLRARSCFQDPQERVSKVNRKYPDLACAYEIYRGKATSSRAIMEAYLLTGEKSDVLAPALRVNSATVDWYRDAYFNVRWYLKHPEYVFARLLRIVGRHGHRPLDEADLWRVVGYRCGFKALNQLLGHDRGSVDVDGDEGVWGGLSQWSKNMLQVKQLLAISRLDPNDRRDRTELLRLLAQEQRHKGNPADAPASGVQRGIYMMLQELPWALGPENIPEPLQEWQDTDAELRAEEEMLVAAGEKPPNLDELRSLQIPLSSHVPRNKPPNKNGP